MNILKKLMMVAVLGIVQAYAFTASAALGYMRISLIETELQIKTPEAGDWGYAAINTPLDVGDEVWVPQGGRAELQLNTGTYIRLDEGTALQILSMDQDSSQFYLSQGKAYIYYDAPQGSVIQVDTPDASTQAFARAIFSLGLLEYYTDVAVYKGYVETENRIGETRVNAGNMVSLGPDTNGEIASIGYLDDWERWNQARDERLYNVSSSQSVRYLPSELRTYYSDFDSHGNWVNVHEYGYVWTPRTYISGGWSPYRHGRWIWRYGDYIWLPYEPWGWAPYHYGRWAFTHGIGWFWVPPPRGSVFWGPGYVGWSRTGNYVGWVPLAPREIYYGRGYYGQYSVNITNVNINEIHYTNVYRNVNVHNGPIVVEHDSFHRRTPKYVELDHNDIQERVFHRNHLSPGPPDVKPEKKNLFLSDREIPKEKLPPQKVRVQPVAEMTKMRPLKRTQHESVFNPGTKPANLPIKTADTPRITGKGKPSLEKIQPGLQEKPRTPEGKRQTGLERRPVQMAPPEPQSQPPKNEYIRKETGGKGQILPEQQRKTMPPLEPGRKADEKTRQTQPVQQDRHVLQPQSAPQRQRELQTQPMEPGQGRVTGREGAQVQPAQPKQRTPQPAGGGEQGYGMRKEGKEIHPVAPPQPSGGPEQSRELRREGGQSQPAQPKQRATQPQPMPQKQREFQSQPMGGAELNREMRMENKQVQPVQPMQRAPRTQAEPQRQRELQTQPQAAPQKQSAPQPQAQRSQPEPPQCGPGQRDQLNPAKCPQNFQNQGKGGGQGR